jgi:hypothetical protein
MTQILVMEYISLHLTFTYWYAYWLKKQLDICPKTENDLTQDHLTTHNFIFSKKQNELDGIQTPDRTFSL